MLKVIITVYATAFVCATARPAGSTWYLSPGGSDSTGIGSRQKPWRTIRFATSKAPDDGSTINLLDGVYKGTESVARQFTKTCTVRAENPCRARLRSPPDANRALTCYNVSNVAFQGLEIFGSGSTRGSTWSTSARRRPNTFSSTVVSSTTATITISSKSTISRATSSSAAASSSTRPRQMHRRPAASEIRSSHHPATLRSGQGRVPFR